MGKIQQRLLGIIACSLIATGLAALLFGATQPLFSIMLRVGLALFAIWLALPQLLGGRWRTSLVLVIAVLGLLVLPVSRRLFPIVGGMLLLAGLAQLSLRYFARLLGGTGTAPNPVGPARNRTAAESPQKKPE